LGHELTVYLIAIMIVFAIGFVVHSVTKINRETKKKIASLSRRLHEVEVPQRLNQQAQKPELPKHLFGEIDIKHPKTGEKLRAPAHFRIKKNR